MEVIAGFGSRSYIFYSIEDVRQATEIYAYSVKDQNGFEDQLEAAGIDFSYNDEDWFED